MPRRQTLSSHFRLGALLDRHLHARQSNDDVAIATGVESVIPTQIPVCRKSKIGLLPLGGGEV